MASDKVNQAFLEAFAVLYGVHSKLANHQKVHIPQLEKQVKDAQAYLATQDIGFKELVEYAASEDQATNASGINFSE